MNIFSVPTHYTLSMYTIRIRIRCEFTYIYELIMLYHIFNLNNLTTTTARSVFELSRAYITGKNVIFVMCPGNPPINSMISYLFCNVLK